MNNKLEEIIEINDLDDKNAQKVYNLIKLVLTDSEGNLIDNYMKKTIDEQMNWI